MLSRPPALWLDREADEGHEIAQEGGRELDDLADPPDRGLPVEDLEVAAAPAAISEWSAQGQAPVPYPGVEPQLKRRGRLGRQAVPVGLAVADQQRHRPGRQAHRAAVGGRGPGAQAEDASQRDGHLLEREADDPTRECVGLRRVGARSVGRDDEDVDDRPLR